MIDVYLTALPAQSGASLNIKRRLSSVFLDRKPLHVERIVGAAGAQWFDVIDLIAGAGAARLIGRGAMVQTLKCRFRRVAPQLGGVQRDREHQRRK